jgi:hypothetical protein
MRTRLIASSVPQLQAAVEAGLVTAYRAGEIAKLPPAQQRAVLPQWTDRSLCRTQGQAIAAKMIRQELKRRTKVNLGRVAGAIRDAIALTNTPSPSHTFAKTRVL